MDRGVYEFRKKTTRLVFTITSVVFFIWLSFILEALYFFDFQKIVYGVPQVLVRIASSLFILLILLGGYKLLSFQTAHKIINTWFFPLFIFVITFATRLFWLFSFGEVKPFSDFTLYMTLAASISTIGKVPFIWRWYVSFAPYVLGYSSFLAFLFKIFGQSLVVAQIANAVFSSLVAVLLFLIGKKITGKTEVGVLAAVLLVALPSQAAMVLLPATELPYITLMLAVIYVCLNIPNHPVRLPGYTLWVFALILAVLMNEIRAIAILTLAGFCVFFVVTNRFTRKTAIRNVCMIVLFLAAFFISAFLLNNVKENFLGLPIARNAYAFGLYQGLNYKTEGHWSQEDATLAAAAEREGLPAQQFHQQMIGLSIQRVGDLIHQNLFIKLLAKKVYYFWSKPNIFLIWVPDITGASAKTVYTVDALLQISNGIYGIILIFTIMESILIFRQKDYAYYSRSLFIKMILLAVLAMHMFYEANDRYVTPAIPLLILLAASGFQETVHWFVPVFTRLARSKEMKMVLPWKMYR